MFDWRAIERWDLNKRDIPVGSLILFREPTLWERYKAQIVATMLVILALTLSGVGLILPPCGAL